MFAGAESLAAEEPASEDEKQNSKNNAIYGEDREAVATHPGEKPLNYAESHHERHNEADREHDPKLAVHVHFCYRHRSSGQGRFAWMNRLEQIPAGGSNHCR